MFCDTTAAHKTQLCKFWNADGVCRKNNTCPFAHGEHDKKEPNGYKTRLCHWYMTTGTCLRGDDCHFAHGVWDVRNAFGYKHLLCRYINTNSGCKLGDLCWYAHDEVEIYRPKQFKTKVCKFFATENGCFHGTRCRFLHAATPHNILPFEQEAQFSRTAFTACAPWFRGMHCVGQATTFDFLFYCCHVYKLVITPSGKSRTCKQ